MNQNQKLLGYLAAGEEMTRLKAMHYGIQNLTARVADLRNAGWQIDCLNRRDQNGARFGTFTLHKSEHLIAQTVLRSQADISRYSLVRAA